jgi:hypothetical protein
MRATTTELLRAFIQPGDEIADARGNVHDVFKVMHSGYGYAGVVLTLRPTGGTGMSYGVWNVGAGGKIRATMTSRDFAAVSAAFLARVTEKAMENGTGEVTV